MFLFKTIVLLPDKKNFIKNKNKIKKLENKIAVVYSDGIVGGAIAKAFAGEGAKVFLTGRTLTKLDAIAKEILSNEGVIETTELDALDEQAVEQHMKNVIKKAGKVDIFIQRNRYSSKGHSGYSTYRTIVRAFFSSNHNVYTIAFHHRQSSSKLYGKARERRDLNANAKRKPYKSAFCWWHGAGLGSN